MNFETGTETEKGMETDNSVYELEGGDSKFGKCIDSKCGKYFWFEAFSLLSDGLR